MDDPCLECHDEVERFDGMVAAWKRQIAPQLLRAERGANARQRARIEELREAGPYQNIEATRVVLKSLIAELELAESP